MLHRIVMMDQFVELATEQLRENIQLGYLTL